MNAKLLVDKCYPAAWVFSFPPLKAGTVVPVERATNIPANGDGTQILFWVNTTELKDDAYGIGLCKGEFEIVEVQS